MSEWICRSCTSPNPPSAMRCEDCGASRYIKSNPLVKTLEDCARCRMVTKCDAHISDGEWKHKDGVMPCKVSDGD